MQAAISIKAKRDHATQRGRDACGTATRMSASLFRRLSACFGSTPDQDPKAAKFAVLIPGQGRFGNVRFVLRVTAPPSETPLLRRVSRCVRFSPKAECVLTFGSESERGPFVREVERRDEKRFGTAL